MLDIGQFLTEIRAWKPRLALSLQQLVNGINQVGSAVGVDPTGHTQAPSAPQGIAIKAAGGIVHAVLTDNTQRSRNLHYFLEADTDPSFPQPHVEHLGVSRGRFLTLPAMDDDSNPLVWYFRAYSMYPGSERRSTHQVFGGSATPTPVSVGGSVTLTPLSSTGSGTASSTGRQGGVGFGNAQYSVAA
jgi:hypothetical protein